MTAEHGGLSLVPIIPPHSHTGSLEGITEWSSTKKRKNISMSLKINPERVQELFIHVSECNLHAHTEAGVQ